VTVWKKKTIYTSACICENQSVTENRLGNKSKEVSAWPPSQHIKQWLSKFNTNSPKIPPCRKWMHWNIQHIILHKQLMWMYGSTQHWKQLQQPPLHYFMDLGMTASCWLGFTGKGSFWIVSICQTLCFTLKTWKKIAIYVKQTCMHRKTLARILT